MALIVNLTGWPGGPILGIRGMKHPTERAHWVDFVKSGSLAPEPGRCGFYLDRKLLVIGAAFTE